MIRCFCIVNAVATGTQKLVCWLLWDFSCPFEDSNLTHASRIWSRGHTSTLVVVPITEYLSVVYVSLSQRELFSLLFFFHACAAYCPVYFVRYSSSIKISPYKNTHFFWFDLVWFVHEFPKINLKVYFFGDIPNTCVQMCTINWIKMFNDAICSLHLQGQWFAYQSSFKSRGNARKMFHHWKI